MLNVECSSSSTDLRLQSVLELCFTAWTQGLQLLEGDMLAAYKPQAEPGPAVSSPMQPHLTLEDISGKKGCEPERDIQTSKYWAHQSMTPNKETKEGGD